LIKTIEFESDGPNRKLSVLLFYCKAKLKGFWNCGRITSFCIASQLQVYGVNHQRNLN
jgi:hypothetical protein